MEAIERFFNPQDISNPVLVLVVGSAGLASNILGLFLFHDHGHSHGHSHGEARGHDQEVAETHQPTHSTPTEITRPRSKSTSSIDSIFVHPAQTRDAVVRQAQQMSYSESNDYLDDEGGDDAEEGVVREEDSVPNDTANGNGAVIIDMKGQAPGSPETTRSVTYDSNMPKRKKTASSPGKHSRSRSHSQSLKDIPESNGYTDHQHGHKHDHSHGAHGHGHSHGGNGSLNMRGVFLHVLGDALGNIGVIATALFIWKTSFSWKFYADPLVSLLITIIIFTSALPLVRSAAFILLQGVPSSIPLEDVRSDIRQLPGVLSVHELHIWQLSDVKVIASVHVLVSRSYCYMSVAGEIRKVLHSFGIHSSTIQPEFVHLDGEEDHDHTHGDGQHMSDNIPETEGILGASTKNYGTLKSQSLLRKEASLVANEDQTNEAACLLRCDEDDACAENACCPPDVPPVAPVTEASGRPGRHANGKSRESST